MLYRTRFMGTDGRVRCQLIKASDEDHARWAVLQRWGLKVPGAVTGVTLDVIQVQPASTCPDCGTAGALSEREARKGYRCRDCTGRPSH